MTDIGARTPLPGGGRENARFRAILTAVVPEAAAFGDDDWRAAEAIIGGAVAKRPASMRRQIGLFVRALDLVSLVRHLRPFAALSAEERSGLLERLGSSSLLPLRRGVWGVRTLAFMGYYARPEAAEAIGYRASIAGWSDRLRVRDAT